MVDLANEYWDVTPYAESRLEFGREQSGHLLALLLEHGIVQVAETEGEVVGLIALAVGPLPFTTGERAASEVLFYVRPGHRGGVGKRLVRQAKNIARQQGLARFNMLHLVMPGAEAAERLYLAEGMSPAEVIYTQEL
jgi:GNAT superfamily N-acetyltransferase